MVAFSALVAFGLRFVPVGRSIVLGYTTPLWVVPGAWLFLHEPMTRSRLAGVGLGLAGLMVHVQSARVDWSDRDALIGSGLILLAALCWAANILYVRAHTLDLDAVPARVLADAARDRRSLDAGFARRRHAADRLDADSLWPLPLFSGIFGIALGHWAMAMVNRSLPAVTTSLGLLATPVVGVVCSTVALGETIDASLIIAMVMILSGSHSERSR